MLTERGTLITKGKLDKLPEINEKIHELVDEKKSDLVRPVAAFITFETEEGKNRCLEYFKDPKFKKEEEDEQKKRLIESVSLELLNKPIITSQAPEPSEILWHNRHVTVNQQNWRKVGVFIAVLIFLALMFALFTWMKSKAIQNMFRYPSTTNCDSIKSIFT